VKKTNAFVLRADYSRKRIGLFLSWAFLVPLIFSLGITVVQADVLSVCETNTEASAMTAWETNSARNFERRGGLLAEHPFLRKSFAFLFTDRDNPWNPWKNPFGDPASSDAVFISGPWTISVPTSIPDTVLELQSIPFDEDPALEISTWDRPPEGDVGSTVQFSENTSIGSPPPVVAPEPRDSQATSDLAVPDAVGKFSKLDFSSAGSDGLRSESSHDPGDLGAAPEGLGAPPIGPVPQIASPEPSVTALFGVSAVVFAFHRKARFKR
jgi:hypothetical protein